MTCTSILAPPTEHFPCCLAVWSSHYSLMRPMSPLFFFPEWPEQGLFWHLLTPWSSYPEGGVIPRGGWYAFCSFPDASTSLAFLGNDLKGCAKLGCRLQASLGEGSTMATFYGRMNWRNKFQAAHSSQVSLLIPHLQCIDASRKQLIPMGRAWVMRSIPTALSHSFSLKLGKKTFLCISMFSVPSF